MFYKVPEFIYSPLAEKEIVKGKVLVINDHDHALSDQINSEECEVYRASLMEIIKPEYWATVPKPDWVVCITQGLAHQSMWALDCGQQIAKKGFCVLDRISFLEPTRNRQEILLNSVLKNIIILSPRPAFRSDRKQLKDSVTSAWFVFANEPTDKSDTKIDYALNWQRPKMLCSGK